jgi:hypothetical protein
MNKLQTEANAMQRQRWQVPTGILLWNLDSCWLAVLAAGEQWNLSSPRCRSEPWKECQPNHCCTEHQQDTMQDMEVQHQEMGSYLRDIFFE